MSLWDLGVIAPPGLREAQFMSALNNLAGDSVWTRAGGGSADFNLDYVPEPATLALLAVGRLAMIRRRRR